MVTAPLLTVGVQVDLPETKASTIKGNDEPLAVSVKKDGRVFIQDRETEVDAVVAKLQAISGNNVSHAKNRTKRKKNKKKKKR